MKTQTIKISLTCLAVLVSVACLRAGTIIKNNNTDNLNLTTSWVGGVIPGPLDAAKWDATVAGANSVALGADTSWGGIVISNVGGPVTINAGNTLTLGPSGIDMSRASQNLTISSGLTLGSAAAQRWNVTNGVTLTANGTFTRPVGATLVDGAATALANQGTVTASPALENGVLPWATAQSSGIATNDNASGFNFATVSGGNIVAYTGATSETTAGTGVFFGGIPAGDNSTVNYDLGVASTGGSLTSDLYVNTLRNTGGTYIQPGTANFRANAIMNAGTGIITISTPIQQADTNLNEIVLAAWTQGITLNGLISDNVYPLKFTVGGTNNQNVIFTNGAGASTFSGGVTINSGRVGISANSTPQSGTVTSGPLGTGPVTMNGGTMYATAGGWAIGNPIIVGPAGATFQFANASPDLTINGNITGSGPVTMAGVFNVNGLFFNGDDSAYNGTVTVTGSNNRLGTSLSGSALAKWVVNGALSAQFVGGATYKLGELSSTTTAGSLNGHAGNLSPAIQNFEVGALNTSSTFSGIIVNNSAGNAQTGNSDAAANNLLGLTKVGTGTLTLLGANTATGPITITGGALQLGTNGTTGVLSPLASIEDDSILIINHNNTCAQGTNFYAGAITGLGSLIQAGSGTTILTAANSYSSNTIVSAGTLLVNGSIFGTAQVMSGAKLAGFGTINDVVTVQPGGQLGAGDTSTNIGTLTLNSTPVLGGTVLVKINGSKSQADLIMVTGGSPIHYGGSLVVSNVNGPLLAGDSFQIFSAFLHSGSFTSIVGSPGPGLAYSFTNGILSVVSTIASSPANITATSSTDISGNHLVSLAWPSDHTGWVLQTQTNDITGSLNYPGVWFDIPGSTNVNLLSITNPTDLAVYFRMRLPAAPIPGGAPTILSARGTNHAVVLSWTVSTLARNYNVKSATTSGGPYSTIASPIATIFTNTGLANGTTYYYVVSAVNYNGETTNSIETNATPVAVVPLPPTGLTAQAAHGLVQLSWTPPTNTTVLSYNVKRGTTTGGPYTTITNVPVAAFLDTTVVDSTTYYYVVSALSVDGEGLNSVETNATPPPTTPTVPTGVAATGQYTQIKVSWTASFGATGGYNVKRSATPGGPYTTFTNTTSTTVYDTGLANNTTNYYVVSAVNGIGESANSVEVNATTTTTLPLLYDFEFTGGGYPAPPLPPLGDPSLPYIQPLPDPFYWASDPLNMGGTGSTNFSDWEHHRAEIKAQIENYEIGVKPAVDPSMITATISGSGTTRTLTVTVTNVVSGTNRTLTITSAITVPSASGTFPAIIGMNSPNGSVNASLLTAVAKITFSHDQVTVYGSQQNTDPYYKLYAAPSVPALDTFNTGQYSAWAWGVSRIIDGLYKLNGNLGGGVTINLSRIGVTGCSYAGKMALFCGALDERVALTIPQESGGGGANSWRYNGFVESPGSVEWLPNTDHNWFRESMFAFGASTNAGFLPEDHHELCALVAPRAMFATGNDGQVWLGTPSTFVCCKTVERIYNNFGLGDRFGYNLMGGHAHCATTSTIDSEMGAFINKFLLGQTSVNTLIRDYPTSGGVMVDNYDTIPSANWSAWWGTTNPVITVLGPPCGTGQAQTPCP